MTNLSETLTFTVPLSLSVHRLAEQFCRTHANQKKAKQVYLNTLAVSSVQFYLRCMGIETDREASSSWNPLMQSLMDVADLSVKNCGLLECRPVLPQSSVVQVPPEVWSDRIGYVAVQIDQPLTEATLLGFTRNVDTPELPVSCLHSLGDLVLHLYEIRQSLAASSQLRSAQSASSLVHLSQWFENIFETGWQSLETILGTNLSFSYRSASRLNEAGVRRAKLVDLGLQLGNQSLALLVAVTPEADRKVGIVVQVHPVGEATYLPSNLKLRLLSDSEEVLQEVQSRTQDNYIQLKRFRGLPGEHFQVQVALNNANIKEAFTI